MGFEMPQELNIYFPQFPQRGQMSSQHKARTLVRSFLALVMNGMWPWRGVQESLCPLSPLRKDALSEPFCRVAVACAPSMDTLLTPVISGRVKVSAQVCNRSLCPLQRLGRVGGMPRNDALFQVETNRTICFSLLGL